MHNFVLQTPSLQRLAAVKIATHLWNQPDIITLIATSFHGLPDIIINEYSTEWEVIEKKVESNASVLSLPEPCKWELSDVIKPIGVEIVYWCQYHHLDCFPFNFLDKLVPLQFIWTMQGTIDCMKTAALIVRDERLDVGGRFEVACLNCLEDDARQLIELIPNHRIHVHKYINEAVRYESMDRRIFVAYFACTLSGDEDLLTRLFQAYLHLPTESINQYLFKVALFRGSGATCEYFFQKINQEEKDLVFREWKMPEEPNQEAPTCRLIFLLSHMKEELFGEYTYTDILECLLRWPMQSLFLKAAKGAWPFMDGSECAEVLDDVILKMAYGYKDYDYAQSFKELWRSSPFEQKRQFLNDIDYLVNLITTKRTEFIQLCLNQTPWHQLSELVESRYDEISEELTDEKVISDAALMGCKERAALKSSNDRDDMGKRLRSEHLSRLIDTAMESRIKSRARK